MLKQNIKLKYMMEMFFMKKKIFLLPIYMHIPIPTQALTIGTY